VKDSRWDRRTKRAEELAAKYSFAKDILGFYARVFRLQRTLYAQADRWRRECPSQQRFDPSHFGLNVRALVPAFQAFLDQLVGFAPVPVAQAASDLRSSKNGKCEELLCRTFRDVLPLESAQTEAETAIALLFAQPYLENFAGQTNDLPPSTAQNLCPFCWGKPGVGVLRPEGEGAKRFLICWRCSTEWAYGRILCASCGEAAIDKLAVYTANQFEHVRIESCDSCRHYLKTVDLTKDGRAVPVVDELATIPLNLWAEEHGYQKIQPNILGL
jgi:formate dehydrogenase accessory protein FdhE